MNPQRIQIDLSTVRTLATSLIANAVYMVTALTLNLYLFSTLGPDGRGALALMQAIGIGWASLLSFGIPSALTYFVKREAELTRPIVSLMIGIFSVAFISAPFLIYLTRIFVVPEGENFNVPLTFAYCMAQVGIGLLGGVMTSLGRVLEYCGALALGNILIIGSIQILSSTYHHPPDHALLTQVTVYLFCVVILILRLIKTATNFEAKGKFSERDVVLYGLRSYLTSVSNVTTRRVDLLIVANLLGFGVAGYYALLQNFREVGAFLGRAVVMAVSSRLNDPTKTVEDRHHILFSSAAITLLIFSTVFLGLSMLGSDILEALAWEKYSFIVSPVLVSLWGGVLQIITMSYAAGMNAYGFPGYQSCLSLATAVLTLACLVGGVAIGTLSAIAYSYAVSQVLSVILYKVVYDRIVSRGPSSTAGGDD